MYSVKNQKNGREGGGEGIEKRKKQKRERNDRDRTNTYTLFLHNDDEHVRALFFLYVRLPNKEAFLYNSYESSYTFFSYFFAVSTLSHHTYREHDVLCRLSHFPRDPVTAFDNPRQVFNHTDLEPIPTTLQPSQ